MEGRHLDITVISAKDLKKVNLIGKMHTYAVVWVDPHYRQSTRVDDEGGSKPEWNHKLSFPVPEHFFQQPNSCLTVEIYSKATLSDDKFVGSASIPLSEIAQKANQEEASTYQVMRKSGKAKGSLRLSVRVGEKTTIGTAPAGPTAAVAMPIAAYPYDSKQHDAAGAPHDNKQHDVAVAVPYGYPPPTGAPAAPAPYGYPPPAPYPQAYGGYGGQGYYQPGAVPPPQYYAAQPPPNRRPGLGGGGMGMGLGAGLLAGAVGGLIVGDIVDDAFDGCDGGFDF